MLAPPWAVNAAAASLLTLVWLHSIGTGRAVVIIFNGAASVVLRCSILTHCTWQAAHKFDAEQTAKRVAWIDRIAGEHM